ncbi:MAG: hypothetical protein RX316_03080, partial [bacterium]|nr:hypothetical protein [bacterium]
MSKKKALIKGGSTLRKRRKSVGSPGHSNPGEKASWHFGWKLSEEEREVYRKRSRKSHEAKALALRGEGPKPIHPINKPKLNSHDFMPRIPSNGIRALSLFSGGGGLDLGFDLAGFTHIASYEILEDAAATLL